MNHLLIKRHRVSRLKYLCKTIKDDYITYYGSGKKWKCHIRKHGRREIDTFVIFQHENVKLFSIMALYYSTLLNVVDSIEYANLKHENGLDCGDTFSQQSESKKKMIKSKLSKSTSDIWEKSKIKRSESISQSRLAMSEEAKIIRAEKFSDSLKSSKKRKEFNNRMKVERCGGGNPTAKPVEIDGVKYDCIKDACDALSLTRSILSNRINSPYTKWSTWKRL